MMIDTVSAATTFSRRSITSSTRAIQFIFRPEEVSGTWREGLVIKTYEPKNSEADQSALNEVRGRRVAREIIKTLSNLPELKEHLHRINVTNAFANFDNTNTLPFASDFFDGKELNFELAKKLPVEIRAAITFIVKALGVNQFPTSSLLIRGERMDSEVGIIDLESAFSLDKPDITTINCLSLLREASVREGSLDRFNQIINEGGDLWFQKLHNDAENRGLENLLSANLDPLINTSSPKDTIEALKTIINKFKEKNYQIEEMVLDRLPTSTAELIDDELIDQLIDREKSFGNLGNDRQIAFNVTSAVSEEVVTLLSNAIELLETGRFLETGRCGHTLKSTISIFCHEDSKALKAAIDLERAGKSQNYNDATTAIGELKLLMPDFCKAIKMYSTSFTT